MRLLLKMKNLKKVTHVIFDMDGLLLDTETGYERIIQQIAHKYGKEYTKEIRLKILGTPENETARIAVEDMQLPITVNEFLKDYKALAFQELQHPHLLPGAEHLIKHLHNHKVPIALATSSSADSTQMKTQDHQGLFSLFYHKVTGGSDPEVRNGKPNPDIFLVCASRFPDKPNPEQCLVFEDSVNGVRGAVRAGMQVVMVPDKNVEEGLRKEATVVLDSLTEFQPELFGLPKF